MYVAGLFGCTSVVIVSEMGVWFSHHFEAPSFLGSDAQFENQVLSTIRDGDPDDPVRMPGPFQLADGDGILNPKFNVQIFISTPKDLDDGSELYKSRIDQIVDVLTGTGMPWAGIEPTRRGYLKPVSEQQQKQYQVRANSKVLIEYDNKQDAPYGEEPKPNQQAIYRVWLEQQVGLRTHRPIRVWKMLTPILQVYEHQWDAKADVQKDASCSNPNQKRQDGSPCSQPAASSGASTASGTSTVTSGTVISSSVPTDSVTKSPFPSSTSIISTTNQPVSTTGAGTSSQPVSTTGAGTSSQPASTTAAGTTSAPASTKAAGTTSPLTSTTVAHTTILRNTAGTTTVPNETPLCVGNQVQGSCIGGTLPSSTPYSGYQGPSCNKADGSPGSRPRLNATVAQEAANQYCQNLVDQKVVLSDSTANPAPGVQKGTAENGGQMSLTVMYYKNSCPEDHSSSTLDFSAMGVETCFQNLYTALEAHCSQDSTWQAYDPQWTFQGGVFGGSCGLFSIAGE